MTTLLIDLTILGIIAFCGWRGYRSGLIRGVFGVVSLVAALFLANIAANAYSEEFTGMLKPFVGGVIESSISDISGEESEYVWEYVEHENDSDEFQTAFNALRNIGLPVPAAIRVSKLALEDETERFLAEKLADTLSSVLAYVAVFGIAFVLVAIIFAVIGNLIGFVFSLPGLKLLDIIAGVAFGLVKGLLIVLTLAAVFRYVGLLAVDTLERTTILNYLVNNNMIADMLGI